MHNIQQQLEQQPHWALMNAYDRAQACCRLLKHSGQPIPGWMQIRQWIGKGSANDIHRAKQDFLAQNSRDDFNSTAAQPDGAALPAALSGTLDAWWQQLRQTAAAEFEQQQAELLAQIKQLMQERDAWQQRYQATDEKLVLLQQQFEQELQQEKIAHRHSQDAALQAQTELAAAQQYQQHQQQHQQQLAQHLAEHVAQQQQQAFAQQQQLERSITALDGLQQFAQQQIEQTRQQAVQQQAQLSAQLNAQLSAQLAKHAALEAQWLQQLSDLNQQHAQQIKQQQIEQQQHIAHALDRLAAHIGQPRGRRLSSRRLR